MVLDIYTEFTAEKKTCLKYILARGLGEAESLGAGLETGTGLNSTLYSSRYIKQDTQDTEHTELSRKL
jgi:hypothetical protein